MSTNLYWEPVIRNAKDLDNALKFALRKRHDLYSRVRLTGEDRNYLLGLCDAGVKDAEKLVSAIDKHGEIDVWEEA